MAPDVLTAIAGITASLAAATAVQFFSRKTIREKQLEQANVDKIVEGVKSVELERRSAVLEALAQRLPDQSGQSQDLLRNFDNVVQQLSIVEARTPQSVAVENLITGYHEQALSQAQAQFWFSVVAATIGFGWILYAGNDIKPDSAASVLKTLPGVVMDAVAFLFFRQASETRQRATELYDRLRTDKQITESVLLVKSIEDVIVRSSVQAQIALNMAGLKPTAIDLTKYVDAHVRQPKS